jgi:hypothetical protein
MSPFTTGGQVSGAGGSSTAIAAVRWSLPASLPQVSVKVVVAASETLVLSPFATASTPWSMVQTGEGVGELAKLQLQVIGVDVEGATVEGLAVNEASWGAIAGGGWAATVVLAVSAPAALEQVSV